MTTHTSTCPLCEANCGLAVNVEDDRIVSVRGDDKDPFSKGYICPKGASIADVQHDPDRLRTPQIRSGDTWSPIGWDEAIRLVADKLTEIQRRHGKDAVGVVLGNPPIHDLGATLYGIAFRELLQTKNKFSSTSLDALPRVLTAYWMYGSQTAIPIPDIDRTDFWLILGANPVVSNGSIMTAPGIGRRIKALKARGGQLVVVDPRRTETAKRADTHLFIRPGTDALLLLALLNVLSAEDRFRLQDVQEHLRSGDVERLIALLPPFTPDAVASTVGIPSEQIRQLALDFSDASSAIAYGRMGTCTQQYGSTSTWLIDVLNLVTGNFDRPGGLMFPNPAFDLAKIAALIGQNGSFGRWRSRKDDLPEFNGELPVAALADELMTPGKRQIRAMVSHAANPVLSAPNGRRIDQGLQDLEFMVSIDIYLNETTRRADVILPPTFAFEDDHFGLISHLVSTRDTVKYTEAFLPAHPNSRHEWQILLALTRAMQQRRAWYGPVSSAVLQGLLGGGPAKLLKWGLRASTQPVTFKQLKEQPHGIDLGPLKPRLPNVLRTKGRKIALVPEGVMADVARLKDLPEPTASLLLIGRRDLRSNNSWMHNSQRLIKGKPRCTLLIHPDDASARQIGDGDLVRLHSPTGEVEVTAVLNADIMPGVVSLPHGWGHGQPGTELSVANAAPGVNMNDVIDEHFIDQVSGTSCLNGVAVEVAPIATESAAAK